MATVATPSLEDEFAVNKLPHKYAYALDYGDVDLLRSIFTADATWQFVGRPGIRNIEQILNIPAKLASAFYKTHHSIQTQYAHLDGDKAHGVTYCMAYHVFRRDFIDEGREPVSISQNYLIKYEDEFAKRDEVWRFTSRKLNVIIQRIDSISELSTVDRKYDATKPMAEYSLLG